MLKSMSKYNNRYFTTFLFPLGRSWGNHAKCCMDGKGIRCLQIVSQHVPIYHPASVALSVASQYSLPGYGDRRVRVRGPGWPDHCVRL